jgi:hypothetical protein
MWLTRQPPAFGVVAAAHLGIPIAAVAVGTQRHLLQAGESAAIIFGALMTIASATVAARLLVRAHPATTPAVLSSTS